MKTKTNKLALFIAPVLTVIVGIILIANSVQATVVICRVIGIILLMSGLFFTGASLLNMNSPVQKFNLVPGLIQLLLGLYITIRPDRIVDRKSVV